MFSYMDRMYNIKCIPNPEMYSTRIFFSKPINTKDKIIFSLIYQWWFYNQKDILCTVKCSHHHYKTATTYSHMISHGIHKRIEKEKSTKELSFYFCLFFLLIPKNSMKKTKKKVTMSRDNPFILWLYWFVPIFFPDLLKKLYTKENEQKKTRKDEEKLQILCVHNINTAYMIIHI